MLACLCECLADHNKIITMVKLCMNVMCVSFVTFSCWIVVNVNVNVDGVSFVMFVSLFVSLFVSFFSSFVW